MRPSAAARFVAALASAAALARPAAADFREVKTGDEIRDREMPRLDGGKALLLGRAQVSVVVFFRPNQDHSEQALSQLATLEKDFAGKPVRFVAVTSDSYDPADVRALVATTGVRMPVLIDVKDALYGELGVKLHPVLAFMDSRHRLAAYQHFLKINMLEMMRAKIQLVLGEINVADLDRVKEPEKSTMGGDRAHAKTRANFARIQLARGNVADAIDSARQAILEDPTYARGHAILGQALGASGKCAEAEQELALAAKLDPEEKATRERVCAR